MQKPNVWVAIDAETVALELPHGLWCLVDAAKMPILQQYRWFVIPQGVLWRVKACHGRKRRFYMHRFLMQAEPGQIVDHINGNPLDNRMANLRFVTPAQSVRNRRPWRKNPTGLKGVTYSRRHAKYVACITHDYQSIHLGYHLTAEAAARAYDEAALRMWGEHARLNFPVSEGNEWPISVH